jgi:hypothetical protein
MDRPIRGARTASRSAALPLAATILAAVLLTGAASSFGAIEPREDAAVQPRKGTYKGKTSQVSVEPAFRRITFKVKGRRITLTTEPVIRRGFCLSPPVFV